MDYLGGVSFADIRLFQGMVWAGFSLCMSVVSIFFNFFLVLYFLIACLCGFFM